MGGTKKWEVQQTQEIPVVTINKTVTLIRKNGQVYKEKFPCDTILQNSDQYEIIKKLPDGWTTGVSTKPGGRTYYIPPNGGESQYERPERRRLEGSHLLTNRLIRESE